MAPNGLGEKLEEDFPQKENSLYAKIKKIQHFFEAPGCAKRKDSDVITFSSKNTFNKSGKSEGQIDHIFCGSNNSHIKALASEGGIILSEYFYDDESQSHYNLSDHFGFHTICEFSFVR